MKKILTFICSSVVLLTACKKDNSSPEPDVTLSKIYGKWNMISSSGGIVGLPTKPTVPTEISIGQDNVLKSYVNGALIQQSHFVVSQVVSGSTSFYKLSLDDASATEFSVGKAKRDTLILWQLHTEAFNFVYIRKK